MIRSELLPEAFCRDAPDPLFHLSGTDDGKPLPAPQGSASLQGILGAHEHIS
jgi:hypothetical protein